MAMGFIYRCAYCGHEEDFVFGPDMSSVFRETKERALAGKLGAPAKRVAEAWPNGCFDCRDVLWVCSRCGRWRLQPTLDYLIKDEGQTLLDCWMGGSEEDIEEEHIRRVFRYRHLCGHCRCEMRPSEESETLRCPHCGGHTLAIDDGSARNQGRSKIKTLEEYHRLSEDLQSAYVEKCIAYWEECGYDNVHSDEDFDRLSADQQEDLRRLLIIFRDHRINGD